MNYVLGAIVGIVYGGLVGFLKYFFLWRKVYIQNSTVTMKMVSMRMIISYVINFITLIVTYFVRNIIPFDFVAFAVATAIALSFTGRIFSIQKVLQNTEIEK